MRFSTRRYLLILFLIIVSIITWNLLLKEFNEQILNQTCNLPVKYQDDLHIFTNDIHTILKVLNLTHFLCYGSLWGEIRLSRLLPWEDKSTLCLLNEEVSTKDELSLARLFKKNGFNINYDNMDGLYLVTRLYDTSKMRVELVLFELDRVVNMYRRIGWKRRLLPPHCEAMESLDCFPPRLIMLPLPIKEFGNNLIPVPREGIELQKYHYKNNWWEEVPLKNC